MAPTTLAIVPQLRNVIVIDAMTPTILNAMFMSLAKTSMITAMGLDISASMPITGVRAADRPPLISAVALLIALCNSTNGSTRVLPRDAFAALIRSYEFSRIKNRAKSTLLRAPPSRSKSSASSPNSFNAGRIAAPCRPNKSKAMAVFSAGSFTSEIFLATSANNSRGSFDFKSVIDRPSLSNADLASRTFSRFSCPILIFESDVKNACWPLPSWLSPTPVEDAASLSRSIS